MTEFSDYLAQVNAAGQASQNHANAIEVYLAAPYQPSPTPSPAPWVVIGSFQLPKAQTGVLSVVGYVEGSAVCSVGLYGPALITSVNLSGDTEHTQTSSRVSLDAGVTYQVAVRFQGTADTGNVAAVRSVFFRGQA